MNPQYILRLYVAGLGPDTQDMIINFKSALKDKFKNSYSLEVVDVIEKPELAVDEKILATPTVVRLLPAPVKKFVLDLANKEHVLIGMDIIKSYK